MYYLFIFGTDVFLLDGIIASESPIFGAGIRFENKCVLCFGYEHTTWPFFFPPGFVLLGAVVLSYSPDEPKLHALRVLPKHVCSIMGESPSILSSVELDMKMECCFSLAFISSEGFKI